MTDLCDICRKGLACTTIFRLCDSDPNILKIIYCNLHMLLVENILYMCDKCVFMLDTCYTMYTGMKGRLAKIPEGTPNSCIICNIEADNVQDYHITQLAPKEMALQNLGHIDLTAFESMFIKICNDCWILMDVLQYFYDKFKPKTGIATQGGTTAVTSTDATSTTAGSSAKND